MHGGQFGEFVCVYWGLTGQLSSYPNNINNDVINQVQETKEIDIETIFTRHEFQTTTYMCFFQLKCKVTSERLLCPITNKKITYSTSVLDCV